MSLFLNTDHKLKNQCLKNNKCIEKLSVCKFLLVYYIITKQYTYYFREKCWLVRIMGKIIYLENGNIHSHVVTTNIVK